jgi:SAM-dependent methyltransferase
METKQGTYTRYLVGWESWWKRFLDVQRPYRRHLKKLDLGFILDLGCGVGRNLVNLGGVGAGVGVDHNACSVAIARSRGLVAFTPDDFFLSRYAIAESFHAILFSHVAEHMACKDVIELISRYLKFLRLEGRVVLITPQESGFRSDPTHVEFMDFGKTANIARQMGLHVEHQYSFPFPKWVGRAFKHNEFVTICRKKR